MDASSKLPDLYKISKGHNLSPLYENTLKSPKSTRKVVKPKVAKLVNKLKSPKAVMKNKRSNCY